MLARSILFSLVRTPTVSWGRSASLAPEGWQAAVSLFGFTISLHYRRYELPR